MESKKINCLIIHGLCGGVYEVKPLADYLTMLGYKIICPVLKGHQASRKEMVQATYKDWIDSAESELLRMKESGDKILLIGFSMGGLIAFNLACRHNIECIVTVNTPIYYWNLYQVLMNLAEDLKNKRFNHTIRYLQAKKDSPSLALIQFLLLLSHTKPILKNINCPTLIIQAKDDDAVKIKSADYINTNISSGKKTIRYFDKGGHKIFLSSKAQPVMSCIKDFIQEHC